MILEGNNWGTETLGRCAGLRHAQVGCIVCKPDSPFLRNADGVAATAMESAAAAAVVIGYVAAAAVESIAVVSAGRYNMAVSVAPGIESIVVVG